MDTQEALDIWKDAVETWSPWMRQAERDFNFYLGNQWKPADAQMLRDKGRPDLTLNMVKKPVDLVVGYRSQNQGDIKVYPIETSDEALADMYTEVIKWIMLARGNAQAVTDCFRSAIVCGLGWLAIDMIYDNDIINGDILITKESPFRMYLDPYIMKNDASDAQYIIRHAWTPKSRVKMVYENKINVIERTVGSQDKSSFQGVSLPREGYVNVTEFWYKSYETKTFILDTQSLAMTEFRGNKEELEKLRMEMARQPEMASLREIRRKVAKVKLLTLLEEQEILYDGYSPYEIDVFPFIPMFSTFLSEVSDWQYKVQGIVRSLVGPQEEKNKRRSQMMAAVMTLPFSGIIADKGTFDNPDVFVNSAGPGVYIEKNPGKEWKEITPPQLSPAFVDLETMLTSDIREIGPNPDLLGLVSEDSGASTPGITHQIRQRQGLITLQSSFDGCKMAQTMLGNTIIELINRHWSDQKIMRITNKPIPGMLTKARMSSHRYDCAVDEMMSAPTYRLATLLSLSNLATQGYPVPPEIMIELFDIPKDLKDKWMQFMMMQRQMEMQAQAAQLQQAQSDLEASQIQKMQMLQQGQEEQQAPAEGEEEQVPLGVPGQDETSAAMMAAGKA